MYYNLNNWNIFVPRLLEGKILQQIRRASRAITTYHVDVLVVCVIPMLSGYFMWRYNDFDFHVV